MTRDVGAVRQIEKRERNGSRLTTAANAIKLLLSGFIYHASCVREKVSHLYPEQLATGRPRLLCQFSFLALCRAGGRDERQVRVPLFGFDAVATDRGSVSILPSISTNGDVNTLLLSSVLCLLFLALISHYMVTHPSLSPPDRPLIPISLLNSQSPQNQRSARISSLNSVSSPVHRTSFPSTPALLPHGLVQTLTLWPILLQCQRCQEIPRETQTHRERNRRVLQRRRGELFITDDP